MEKTIPINRPNLINIDYYTIIVAVVFIVALFLIIALIAGCNIWRESRTKKINDQDVIKKLKNQILKHRRLCENYIKFSRNFEQKET